MPDIKANFPMPMSQGVRIIEEQKLEQKQKQKQKQDIQKAITDALVDGVISNDEIVRLAKLNFTVEDVQNAFESSVWCAGFSDDDKQRLTDDLMTRIETYRKINQERKGQDPQFGL